MRRNRVGLGLLLKTLFDKENLQDVSTWIGLIAGGLNTLATFNKQLDLIPDTGVPFIDALLSIATCIAAFYLVFLGVPAIAGKRSRSNGYPDLDE